MDKGASTDGSHSASLLPKRHSSTFDIHDTQNSQTTFGVTKTLKKDARFAFFLMLGFFSTTFNGLDLCLNRYLQRTTKLDGVFLITLRAGVPVLLFYPYIHRKVGVMKILRMRYLTLFAILHVGFSLSNTYAPKYTLAYYVAAIKLTSPFLVAIFCRFLNDPLPKYTIPAMILSGIGALLTVTGDGLEQGKITLTASDLIGIALSLLTAIIMALNQILYTKIQPDIPSYALFWLQSLCQFLVSGPISFVADDWIHIWGTLDVVSIVVLVIVSIDSILSDMFQISSVRFIGAALYVTLSPWALVVTLGISATPFLGDPVGVLNIVGSVIIVVVVGVYLFVQYTLKYENAKAIQRTINNSDDLESVLKESGKVPAVWG